MITKPTAYCPLCGSRYGISDIVGDRKPGEAATWYGECDCGAADITVRYGKVVRVIRRDPIDIMYWADEPITEEDLYLQSM